MSTLVFLVGLPASGKSTFAKLKELVGYKVHSSDAIRKELYGNECEQKDGDKVFQLLYKRIAQDLKNGKDCVLDSTGLTRKRRSAFLNYLHSSKIDCVKKCYFFATPIEECLERNKSRDRVVPEYVIKRMYKSIEIPQWYEGWDDIIVLWGSVDSYKHIPPYYHSPQGLMKWMKIWTYDQGNSHHKLTLGQHCFKAREVATENNFGLDVSLAALLHDIGKPYTRTNKNAKGIPDGEIHYYGHENVSAYLSLFVQYELIKNGSILGDKDDILYVAQLISLHMLPYSWEANGMPEKWMYRLEPQMYDDLWALHRCDVEAH